MKTSFPLTLAGLCLMAYLSACDPPKTEASTKTEPPRPVKTVHPLRGEVHRFLTLPAEVHPLYQVTLYAKVAGYLDVLTVDKGDAVKSGDLIANIDVPELQVEKVKYEAELELATANLQQVSATQRKAGSPPEGTDDVDKNLAIAKAKLSVAKANVKNTDTMLNYARIKAPFDGVITKRYVDPGAFIPAPNAADTPEAAAIVNVTDFATLRIQIPVPETEVPHISVGEAVEMTTDDLPGRRFAGKVTRFYYALDRHTKTMLTEVWIPNPNLELRPGMLMSAQIDVEKKDDALLVPRPALVKEKANNFVFIAVDSRAKKVPVTVGFSDGPNVEIVSGVKPEDEVLTAPQSLREGEPIVPDKTS